MRWSTGRLEAFSDGVLAIAITLLVLEIEIEPPGFENLWRALAEEWPAYLAYVTSFLTIGGVWLAHHALFERLSAIDPVLMRLNLLLLMAVSFLPFPTALMSEALRESQSAERAAVVVYGLDRRADRAAAGHGLPPRRVAPGAAGGRRRPAAGGPRPRRIRFSLYGLLLLAGILVFPRARGVRLLRRRGLRRALTARRGPPDLARPARLLGLRRATPCAPAAGRGGAPGCAA